MDRGCWLMEIVFRFDGNRRLSLAGCVWCDPLTGLLSKHSNSRGLHPRKPSVPDFQWVGITGMTEWSSPCRWWAPPHPPKLANGLRPFRNAGHLRYGSTTLHEWTPVLIGLRLHNIALIEELELRFDRGFTVLTGETGAGKSILLDALDALLGGAQGAQGARLLRRGCHKGSIEATFAITPTLRVWLEAQALDGEETELLISREWCLRQGKLSSRHRLQGVAVSRGQILELRPLLMDLTVQGQTQQLARPGQQRRWLDRFAGESLLPLLEEVRSAHRVWKQTSQALLQTRLRLDDMRRERQHQEQVLGALEAAALEDPLELARLQAEQDRLAHGVRLQEGMMTLMGRMLEGAEGAPSALDHLAACDQELQLMEGLDGAGLAPLREGFATILTQVQEFVRDLDRYGASLESDPERLALLQERIALLRGLERRHGQSLADLIALRDSLRQQLSPAGLESELLGLERREAAERARLEQACQHLTAARQATARGLEAQLMEALRPMGLAHVRFAVEITPVVVSDEGADGVSYLFSANPGQPLAPLAEVASGGEMSRFLLALKTCLAAADADVTLLFDEIDAGVSGRVSGAMAELLKRLAQTRQVFCVTHQPLVAAAAQHHFKVAKVVESGQTHTRVSHLRDTHDRQAELAELAGGDSGEARSYAASLLEQVA
jgi:DNA repair protein RecN (Recombination protein N)